MSMDRLLSRSVPHIPRYQSTSPARSPRLDTRRFASLHSVSSISYIDGELSRGIHSYHTSPTRRSLKVHLMPVKHSRHLVRSTRSLSQTDLRSSHVYTSLDELCSRVLREGITRENVSSYEDVHHRRPFFPDLTGSESGVSLDAWEEGSQYCGEDDSSSQRSFGSSSAIFDATLDSQVDRAFVDHMDGYDHDHDEVKRRSTRRSSLDLVISDTCLGSFKEKKRKQMRDSEKSRLSGLKVQIPSEEKSEPRLSHGTSAAASKPLAQSTPHVSPRGKGDSKLSIKASWTVDDPGGDPNPGSRPDISPASRFLNDTDASDADVSRCGESSLNTSFSNESISDLSSCTIISPVPRSRPPKSSNRSDATRSKPYGLSSLELDDCGYGTDHYHSQVDLPQDTWSAPLVIGNRGMEESESWAFYSFDTPVTATQCIEKVSKVHKSGQLKIPLIAAGKQGQEKLRKSSPPVDRSPPHSPTSGAFHAWLPDMDRSIHDLNKHDHVTADSHPVPETSEHSKIINTLVHADHRSFHGLGSEYLCPDTRPTTLDSIADHDDSGLVLLNDSASDGQFIDHDGSKVTEGRDRTQALSIAFNIYSDNSGVGAPDLQVCTDVITGNYDVDHCDANMEGRATDGLMNVTCCDVIPPMATSLPNVSHHLLKKDQGNFHELDDSKDDASTCDIEVAEEGGEWWTGGVNSWDLPMSVGPTLMMRQPTIDSAQAGDAEDKERPRAASLAMSAGLTRPAANIYHGETPLINTRALSDNVFVNLEDINSSLTGFGSLSREDADHYSSIDSAAENYKPDLEEKFFASAKNNPSGKYTRDGVYSVNGDFSSVICDMEVSDTSSAVRIGIVAFDTGIWQQGGECDVSVPVGKSIIKDGSNTRGEFRISGVTGDNTVRGHLDAREDHSVISGIYFELQDCTNKDESSVSGVCKVNVIASQTGDPVLNGASPIGKVIDTKLDSTHMESYPARGEKETSRGNSDTQSERLIDGSFSILPVPDAKVAQVARGNTSGLSLTNVENINTRACDPCHLTVHEDDHIDVLTNDVSKVTQSDSMLENLRAQLFHISSLEDDDRFEVTDSCYTDFAQATSASPARDEGVMDELGTYYSYSISVREPEPESSESVTENNEPPEREQYDNDDMVIDTRTYTFRRHFPSSLAKSGHKSSSLWTLQEETESLVDAQSPRSSPKHLQSGAHSEEGISSNGSPIGSLTSSEEKLIDLVSTTRSPETDSAHPHEGVIDTIISADMSWSKNGQAKLTPFCGPFPLVSPEGPAKSPLDVLSDTLEQFYKNASEDRQLQSDAGLGTDDLTSDISSRLHDFDNDMSFISSSASLSPSECGEGSPYTCIGSAQVKTLSSSGFDYDTLSGTSVNHNKLIGQQDESTMLTDTPDHQLTIDEQFEKILKDFSAIVSPFTGVDHVALAATDQLGGLYKDFTNHDAEKKQNHNCLVVEEDSMDVYRFKKFLKKSHTKRKKGKKLLRFLSSLGCVSEGAHSPELSPRRVRLADEHVFSMDNMVTVKPSSFQEMTSEVIQPPRGNSPTSSNHSLDSIRSRADSAYSSFSESLQGEMTSSGLVPPKYSSTSSVFFDGGPYRSRADSSFLSTSGDAEVFPDTLDSDLMTAFSEVFEQLDLCEGEIDSALLKRLRHGHHPAPHPVAKE